MSIWAWMLILVGWFAAGVLWALAFRVLGLRFEERFPIQVGADPTQLSLFDRGSYLPRPRRVRSTPRWLSPDRFPMLPTASRRLPSAEL